MYKIKKKYDCNKCTNKRPCSGIVTSRFELKNKKEFLLRECTEFQKLPFLKSSSFRMAVKLSICLLIGYVIGYSVTAVYIKFHKQNKLEISNKIEKSLQKEGVMYYDDARFEKHSGKNVLILGEVEK